MNQNVAQHTRGHALGGAPVLLCVFLIAAGARGQSTLRDVVQAAIQNSERIKIAKSEVDKANAALTGARDVYIPSVAVSSGLGASSGITLNVPTIFTVSAQSLVFSYSQRNYVRAAHFGVDAALQSLVDVRQQVEEDAAITYVSLVNVSARLNTLSAQHQHADRLVAIMNERFTSGFETQLETLRVKKEAAAINLQQIQAEHKMESLRQHLSVLTGSSADVLELPNTLAPSEQLGGKLPVAELNCKSRADLLSIQANAQSTLQTSFGDARYTWRPQVSLQAQYGRISPLNGVSTYYNLHGNYNTLAVGVQIQLPLLDFGRHAHARETAADAAKAQHQVTWMQQQQREACSDLQRSLLELLAQLKLAGLEYEIAASELAGIETQASNQAATSSAVTPKEIYRARMQAGQKLLDRLTVAAQLQETYVHYLRLNGTLETWIADGAAF